MVSKVTCIFALTTGLILTIVVIGLSIHFTLPKDEIGIEQNEIKREEKGTSFLETNMSENKDEVFKGILEVITKTKHMVGNITTIRHLEQNNHNQKLHSITEQHETKRVSLIMGVVIGICIIFSCTGICVVTIKLWHANLVFQRSQGTNLQGVLNEKNGNELFPEVKLDPEH